jgi:hypothetical protein
MKISFFINLAAISFISSAFSVPVDKDGSSNLVGAASAQKAENVSAASSNSDSVLQIHKAEAPDDHEETEADMVNAASSSRRVVASSSKPFAAGASSSRPNTRLDPGPSTLQRVPVDIHPKDKGKEPMKYVEVEVKEPIETRAQELHDYQLALALQQEEDEQVVQAPVETETQQHVPPTPGGLPWPALVPVDISRLQNVKGFHSPEFEFDKAFKLAAASDVAVDSRKRHRSDLDQLNDQKRMKELVVGATVIFDEVTKRCDVTCHATLDEFSMGEIVTKLMNHEITSLSFSNCQLTDDYVNLILDSVKNDPQSPLEYLKFHSQKLEKSSLKILAELLQANEKVKVLELQKCDVNDDDAVLLVQSALSNPVSSLAKLDLSGNQITDGTRIARLFEAKITGNIDFSLKTLSLPGNQINSEGMNALKSLHTVALEL